MTQPVLLDETDHRILELLSEDARRTVADIAARVALSPAPVKRRIDRLARLGVIKGYTVVLDHAKIGESIEAFTELRFAGSGDVDEIVATVAALPEVQEVYTLAGDTDAIVRTRVDDVEHLKRVVNVLRRSGKITGTRTLIVLDRWARDAGSDFAAPSR
ncbi:MAG TPA: Lrp/AsnC family transcriptional regulator [Solirubrobacteraceae bacterium]|nr:Lrp/AsnC family transcriptional regulator [Solirubrobacteraceae bacterium]